jgi:hypothetical protein
VKDYQYLKGEYVGTGVGKEELLLQVAQCLAQRSRDLKVLNIDMAKLPKVDQFYTCKPHLVGDKVFKSQKHKANVPLDFE